jgi:cytochrome c553
MKIAASILTLSIACAFLASPAAAQGDAERGAKLAYTCLGCHGIGGYRNAYPSYRVPKIGGQKAAYLVAALQGYRDGTRQHPTMQAQASSMSDEDMQDLAASRVSKRPRPASPATARTASRYHRTGPRSRASTRTT